MIHVFLVRRIFYGSKWTGEMAGKRLIIGVGNPDRGDDAVGRIAAKWLRGRIDDGIEILESDGEVTALIECLENNDTVYLIDAAASGRAPGSIHRFDANAGPLPQTFFALSTHGFGLAEAVELARAVHSLPSTCVIYAVEGACFAAGMPLSDAVAGAAEKVMERLLGEFQGQGQDTRQV
jgi:hydrogenase maturation protease